MNTIEYMEFVTNAAKKYANRKSFYYSCVEEFVLRNGKKFQPQKLPKQYKRGQLGQCYKNSYELALKHNLVYVEGFALSVIPTIHAWCVIPETDLVIDPTWREPGLEYFGVPIKFEYVLGSAAEYERYGVIDNWYGGYPILVETNESKWRIE